jgi:hypothetical protein
MRGGNEIRIFALQPAWDADGNAEFHLVDAPDGLFDADPLHKSSPLVRSWTTPVLVVAAARKKADAYFCPGNCFFFSARARKALEPVVVDDAEWLSVEISGLGEHFALHPLRHIRLADTAKYRANGVGNIVEVSKPAFEREDIADATLFCAAQPQRSAAGKAGFCLPTIYMNDLLARHFTRFAGVKVAPVCTVGA